MNSPDEIIFEGVIDVFGEHPVISLSDEQILDLSGAPASYDFSNTSTVTVTVPDGVTYTSASGVFGTESASDAPEPGSLALLKFGSCLGFWPLRISSSQPDLKGTLRPSPRLANTPESTPQRPPEPPKGPHNTRRAHRYEVSGCARPVALAMQAGEIEVAPSPNTLV